MKRAFEFFRILLNNIESMINHNDKHSTILLLNLVIIFCLIAKVAKAQSPNIILINVDDLGWSDVAPYGVKEGNTYYETPNISRLAGEGMVFESGYASCTVCSPTRASLMTGKYPQSTGVTSWIRPNQSEINPVGEYDTVYAEKANKRWITPSKFLFLDPTEITIAEILKVQGYSTGHIGKWHLGGEHAYPEKQGFDFNFGGCHWGQPKGKNKPNPVYFDPYENSKIKDEVFGEYLTDREAREAVGFIERAVAESKPFFLNMAHYAVHGPIQSKEDKISKYKNKQKPKSFENLTPVYAAMVESVDDAVGTILNKLDELGIADNTVVFFTSDNGGVKKWTDLRPLRGGKTSPYEGGHRVPWIVRWPGVVKPGSSNNEPIISMDFLPTVCEIVDAPLPTTTIDGLSFVSLLKGKDNLEREDLIWHYPHYQNYSPFSVIRSGKWKLIRLYEDEIIYELYDLSTVEGYREEKNLAILIPDKVDRLRKKMDRMLIETTGRLPVKNMKYSQKANSK